MTRQRYYLFDAVCDLGQEYDFGLCFWENILTFQRCHLLLCLRRACGEV